MAVAKPSKRKPRPAKKARKATAVKKAARKVAKKAAKKTVRKAARKKTAAQRKKPVAAKKRKPAARKKSRPAAAKKRKAVKAAKATKATKAKKTATAKKAKPSAAKAKKQKGSKAKVARRKVAASQLPAEPPKTKSYMSPKQREWFRRKLESMLEEIQHEAEKTAKTLREQEKVHADEFDRANSEFAFVVDLRENERISNLQVKINHALRQIDEATYGFCDDCGVEIGLERMTARPVATKCIDCKEFQENLEKHAI